jgi:serine/threonine-protein kinase
VVVAILFFSAIVPVHPLRMAVAAAAAASTDALGLLATIWIQGNPVPKWNLWLWILVPDAVSVPLAVATSRFLYTVGRSLERAREMGSYRLIEKLGEGGMGEVWSARHRMLARPAAVKLIPRHRLAAAGDGEGAARLLRRFEREAQATASLQSPHTIEVYDFGVDETGAFFYVMELLDGLSLHALVEEAGPLPPGRAVRILLGMCHSLEDAHAHGLIHRDIKPSNVFLCRRGLDFDFVKVLDFGLVKQESDAASAEDTRLTKEGSFIGSPGYMAPEVFKGLAPTRSVDIYAFGCVAYWLLAGRQVFEAPTAMMLFYAHLNHRPDPLYYTPSESPRGSQISREHAPQAPAADQAAKRGRPPEAVDAGEDLPPLPSGQRGRGPSQTRLRAVPALCAPARANVPEALDRLVLRCLEKEPADRPASFEEIVKELESTGLAAQWTADDARAWWAERTPGGPTRE